MQNQPFEFKKLIRCWQAMPRAATLAPKKTTFSPVNLSTLMPFLFLIEKQQDGILSVRILGSELEKKLNITRPSQRMVPRRPEVLGRYKADSVFATMMDRDWDFYGRFMDTCTGQLCGGRLNRHIRLDDGRLYEIDSLHLPLADTEGVARFMLGVMLVWPGGCCALAGAKLSPKEAILDYQYVDLGAGRPAGLAVALPASNAIKIGAAPARPAASSGTKSRAGSPGSKRPTYVI